MGSKIRDTTAPSLPLPVFNSKSKRPSVEFCPKCLKVRRRLALSGDSLLTPPWRPLVAGSGTPPAHRPLVANSLGRRPPPRHAACTGGLRYRATFILTPRRKHASRTPTRTRTQSCTRAPLPAEARLTLAPALTPAGLPPPSGSSPSCVSRWAWPDPSCGPGLRPFCGPAAVS